MTLRHEHTAIPAITRQRDKLRRIADGLGRNPDIDIPRKRLLGDLDGIALMKHEAYFRKTCGKFRQHGGQHIASLRVRRCDAEDTGVFGPELVGNALQVRNFPQRPPCGRYHHFAGRSQRCQPLALPHEHPQAKLILELPNLFADTGLRRIERLSGVGNVEPVVDDRAEIAKLLEVHGCPGRLRGGLYDPRAGLRR